MRKEVKVFGLVSLVLLYFFSFETGKMCAFYGYNLGLFWMLIFFSVLVSIFYLMIFKDSEIDPRETLEVRYVKGEISKERYLELKKILGGD
ncbi:MAG: hypothetical protein ACE5HW_06210 [Candidatus Methanofastidiosia archaeon]